MRKYISILITVLIFVVIFRNINTLQFRDYLINMNIPYFLFSMFLFIPIIVLWGERWRIIIHKYCKIDLKESIKLIMSCGSLNSITPSKIGDFGKAYFLKKELGLRKGVGAVIFEKYLDLFVICLYGLMGFFFIIEYSPITLSIIVFCLVVIIVGFLPYFINLPKSRLFKWIFKIKIRKKNIGKTFEEALFFLEDLREGKVFRKILILTLVGWIIQFVQIYFFFLALGYAPPIPLMLGFVTAAIIIGLLPLTIGGMGTRDSVLIILFSGYAPAALMLGIGILMSLRYWIPALFGLIFLKDYIKK